MARTGPAARPEDVQGRGRQLDEVARRIGARFPRSETRDRVRAYVAGLLGPIRRKNAWQVAEPIGDGAPTASSTSWAGPIGTPTSSATTCGATSWSPSAT